jgi:prefoldin subunit 2
VHAPLPMLICHLLELQAQYNQFKSALTQLSQKIGDIESQSEEHKLVIETLDGVDESRKCFRMVGGVLVEKTVGDVKPVLKTNHEGLQNVLKKMEQEYKTKDKEMQDWQKKHNVQVVRTN